MKPDTWHGHSADTTDAQALRATARKLRVGVEVLELKRTGGAVLVRRREGDRDAG